MITERDRFEIAVHFACGAVFGVILGFIAHLVVPGSPALWMTLGGAALVGLVSAVVGETFWRGDWGPLRWFDSWWH